MSVFLLHISADDNFYLPLNYSLIAHDSDRFMVGLRSSYGCYLLMLSKVSEFYLTQKRMIHLKRSNLVSVSILLLRGISFKCLRKCAMRFLTVASNALCI